MVIFIEFDFLSTTFITSFILFVHDFQMPF